MRGKPTVFIFEVGFLFHESTPLMKSCRPPVKVWFRFIPTLVVLGALATVPAEAPGTETNGLTLDCLKKMSTCELERLFELAPAGEIPVGFARGHVLLMTDARMPRLRARLSGALWKGKHFDEDGAFINQWPGFRALRSHAEHGTSWHDSKPCIVIEYPRETPVFGNNRDEIREVAPGLFLARLSNVARARNSGDISRCK